MNRVNLGLSLKSHNFREHSAFDPNTIKPLQKTFRCTKCGFVAAGTPAPTVYITSIVWKTEILSCDEMMIKDIIE